MKPVVIEPPDHATVLAWRPEHPSDLVVIGPRTRARYHDDRPGPRCFRLRFGPGRAPELLGRPLDDIADRTIRVADLDTGRSHALVAQSHEERLRLLALPPARPSLAEQATSLLTQGLPVAATARRLHVSERHLRNAVVAATGLTPSAFVRIARVRTVLAGIGRRLPDLAAEAGYYDQSHMGADFRRLMNTTPGAFARGHRPATEPCPAR